MPLTAVTTGAQIKALDVQQLINLLTNVMTDQAITVANTLAAKTVGATGKTGLLSPATTNFVGRWTTTGAPTGLTGAVGDYGIDGGNTWWYCTVAGTPGTWIQMSPPPNTNAGNIVALGAAAAAGSSGLSADASHVHPWTGLAVLSLANTFAANQTINGTLTVNGAVGGITTLTATNLAGTLTTAAQPNVTSLGTLTSLALAGAITGVTTLTATTLNGTLGTAAQPNVTSLGTLTTLIMSGSISGVTDFSATGTGYFGPGSRPFAPSAGDVIINRGGAAPGTGALYFGSSPSPGYTYLYWNGTDFVLNKGAGAGNGGLGTLQATLITAAQPNITSVGTLSGLNVGGGGLSVTGVGHFDSNAVTSLGRWVVGADTGGNMGGPANSARLNGGYYGGGGASSVDFATGSGANYVLLGSPGAPGSTATTGVESVSATTMRIRYGIGMGATWAFQYISV